MKNGIADSAVGAILEIPPSALADIQKAERYIDNLQIASKRAADAVKTHWGEVATSGLDTFIQKLADAQNVIKGMSGGKVDFNINTTQATQNVSDASKHIEKDLYAISKTVQQVAQDFDFSNPEASLKKWGNTFREIEAQIRNTDAARKGMATDDPEVDKYNRLIEVLKEYVAQKKKSQETVGAEQAKAAQDYEKWWLSALAKRESEESRINKKLTNEYKRLYAENQKLFESMRKYHNEAGGTPNTAATGTRNVDAAYRKIEDRHMEVLRQMRDLESKNIQEIANFRQQRDMEANQRSISEFIQAEAQKTAEAKKQADERARQQAEAQQKYLNSAQGAMWYSRQLNKGKVENSYENRERAIKQLESAIKSLDKNDKDYDKTLEKLTRTLNILKNAQKEVADAMKPTKPMVSPQDAINAAKNATSLKQLQDAYKQLKEVMANTDPKSQKWADMNTQLQKTKTSIDEIKKKMGEFQGQASKTSSIMNQLQGRIAAAFSIGAITGFIKKMVEVRAQFELQRVALGAILQDKDKADKIFLQVQQMALESPFSIMQLERATKQIAAFGFEADKLKPTLKMLADMSAGLGVEIDRLVLVMGHLKARNYLEGTMVRQFTNAGFNVLGELAKYYTELEGRMVSVAEVQTRVKKKMVEFGDVEEVLKRVTSAGGMFYDMQKKQSDSLWGQMQRITDAYDLMLNEIGKDNQSVISKALTAIRALINSWRTLAPIIKDVGYAMAAVFAIKGIQAMFVGFTSLGKILIKLPVYLRAIKMAITGMNMAWSTTGIGAVVAITLTAIEVFRGLRAESKALQEEMGRIGDESVKNLNESITSFKLLADVMGDGTKSYVERKEAMKEMKRVFADILPQEKMEIAYIESLKGNYSELMDTISEYYRAKEYQHKYEAVLNSSQAKSVQDEIERTFKRMNKDQALGLIFSDAQLKAWAEKLANELNTGKIPNAIDSIKKRMQEMFPDAKNVDKYFKESYGSADFTDVIDKVDKVRDAFGDISLSTSDAANALAMYNAQLRQMDFGQLENEQEKIAVRIREIETSIRNIESSPQTTDPNVMAQRANMLEQLNTELLNYRNALDSVAEAKGKVVAKEFYEQIDSETKEIQKVYQEYWRLELQMRDLKTQGKELTPEFEKLKEKQDMCGKSADDLVKKYRLGDEMSVSNGFLDATETSYELNKKMDEIAKKAFPSLAAKAQENMDKFKIAILKGEKTWWGFLSSLKSILPSDWTKEWGDLAVKMKATDEEIKALSGDAGPAANEVDEFSESMGRLYSDISKDVAKKYGSNFERMNTIMSDSSKGAKDMATELRNESKALTETTKAYDAAKKKGQAYVDSFLKGQHKTAEEIEQMKKDAQAFSEAADRLWIDEKKSGGRGKDPELELWKNRIKAVQEYYTAREKARKNLSVAETEPQQRQSFKQLWKDLNLDSLKGLSLNDLIAQGFDPKKLQTDLVSSLERLKTLIPSKYEDVRKEIERTIAKEKIEIQFKIKESEREQLQKSITDMFDNYALTKELGNLGVNVDLTYMVGGKPTTLADIRREYERLMVDFANKSKEEQKIIKKMGEDLTKKEYDNRKKQLQNYVKYLTESMGERAQIEIKALQDVNKIREDETLDSFSKEQAIMQRRKKMYEDLSKMDLDSLKSSDVYISVFKDLESASKEQLQYVLDKLRELQSTFKDLSPAQVKSIASEMKKIEDALADKDSVKNLGANLRDAIKYARQRNELLREQTNIQDTINKREDSLARGQAYLYELQIKLKGIQDESSDEWQEANRRVQEQQSFVKELQEQIEELKRQLEEITGKINKGSQAWTSFRKGMQNVAQYIDATKQALDDIFDGIGAAFNINDATRDAFESVSEIMGGLSKTVNGLAEIDIERPFTLITGLGKAIGGVFSTIGGFFGIGDKKKEREIQRLTEKVETLDKAYQKLEKSIESAYTFSDYNAGYKQMQRNLESQKRAYQEMIRLEESKKKTDDEKIKEYKEKIQEIADAQDELRKERLEVMGSTSDYLSEAQSFVDAWLDAYKEVGDGTDALIEQWDDFLSNLFVKQAAAQIISTRVKKLIDNINQAIEEGNTDYDLKDMVKEATDKMKAEAPIWNELLTNLADAYGLKGGAGELILSDLQKGIQNITEPQAAAIESYLNSMRFAVFRHTEQLDTLIATIQMQYGSGAENPVVTELKGIRGVLDNIYRDLHSVVKNGVGKTYIQVG